MQFTEKIIKAEPAKYPKTSVAEAQAKATFEYIICLKNVKPYLNEMDKIPNYDGYLEIKEDNQIPIGKIEVQLKKLSDDELDKPKYQCKLEFLSYCENSILPVLLIVVDTKNEVAYWILVNRDLLSKLNIKSGAESVNVEIPKENFIKKDNSDYLLKWIEIINNHKIKLIGYDSLKQENEKLKESYSILLEKSESTLGLEREEFMDIHRFLDFLNHELDTNFKVIKDFYFQSAWKIGFAYLDYADDEICYVLYPIPYNKNDVHIKKMSKSLRKELRDRGLTFTSHYADNPIKLRPESYALEIIHDKLKRLLETKLLPIKNITLAREFIFSFVDRFNIPLGLKIKDEYSVDEIKNAFIYYLPIWIVEALKIKKILLGNQGFIDPDLILSQLLDSEREEISKKVKERLSKKDYTKGIFPVGNTKYSFGLLVDVLDYLKIVGSHEIKRLYLPKDYDRLKGKSGFIWSWLAPNDVKKNIEIFFNELPDVYDTFIDEYFPNLKSQLHFFKDFDRLIIVIDVKEEYNDWNDAPSIEKYYLKNKEFKERAIDVYMITDKNTPVDRSVEFKTDIQIDGKIYQLHSMSYGVLDFIYNDMPMIEYVYKLLNKKFEVYFTEQSRVP